jgi:LmbE family N-acetylglucosaminyl deacetylase
MKLSASLALALCLATSAQQSPAQTAFTDPANLRGERVQPIDGHELPIDLSEAQGGRGLAQLLRKLNTRASILNIVAHPDDEDGGMLTLYARGFGARVADLSLTRGEGGQNFVTGDFEDALGLIRTQELLANDRYTGVTQMFGTEVDFGFSKTREESFQKWTHDRVLYDAVRAIRLYRPLVITATFIGNVTDGHGQHQVSGEIAQEAFKAAADPTIFPDMIKEGILPWQALKVYARVPFADISAKGVFDYATDQYVPARFTNYVTGKVTTAKPTADVIVPEGATDPLLTDPATNQPRSYVQFARIGLGLQRTQISRGMRLPSAGAYDSGYTLYGSVLQSSNSSVPHPSEAFLPKELANQPNFFDGIDTSIEGIATLAPSAKGNVASVLKTNLNGIQHSIAEAGQDFKPGQPALAANRLAEALTLTDMTIKNVEGFNLDQLPLIEKSNVLHELRIKRVQLNDALILALGITFDATTITSTPDIPAATPRSVATKLTTTSSSKLFNQGQMLFTSDLKMSPGFIIADGNPGFDSAHPVTATLQIKPESLTKVTRPYFSRKDIEQPFYDLDNAALRNAPATPAAMTITATIIFHDASFEISRIVHNSDQPVSIVPPVSVASAPSATVLRDGQTTAQLTATLHTDASTSANINVQSPHNWSIEAKAVPASAADTAHSVDFLLHPTTPVTGPQLFHVTAKTPDLHTYSEGFRPVGYPGLITTNYYTPATTRVVPVDLKLPEHLRIAYLPGTGDAVPEALASIGLTPTILTVADLTPAKLANFDTVILGVRTYTAHSDLHGAPTQALLDFARNGGNVLVQYQTAEFTSADAPYPFSLGDAEKVVDEADAVQLLAPASSLFTAPNPITTADFDHWIEERGHGFLESWDSHYTALTETHDPGGDGTAPQLPQRGGLITASVGKGRWTYCAFALYRQLPEAVPGAYRLFVNLISPAP